MQEDLEFYEKISPVINGVKYLVPTPTLCLECRQQRKLIFRNDRSLYHRNCDKSGKALITIYSPNKPYSVYAPEVWWGDQRDVMEYGKDYDFTRSFFQQFEELYKQVPKISITNVNSPQSEYCHNVSEVAHSYLSFGL